MEPPGATAPPAQITAGERRKLGRRRDDSDYLEGTSIPVEKYTTRMGPQSTRAL